MLEKIIANSRTSSGGTGVVEIITGTAAITILPMTDCSDISLRPIVYVENHAKLQIKLNHFIVKTMKLTPRPRMAFNGAALQQQLTVHNANTKCQTTRVTNKNETLP